MYFVSVLVRLRGKPLTGVNQSTAGAKKRSLDIGRKRQVWKSGPEARFSDAWPIKTRNEVLFGTGT
jgi:hypothetical protein